MAIIFREVNSDSIEEIRELLITHELSWKDSEPECYIAKTDEQRDKSARNFMKSLKEEDSKKCGICAFDDNKIIGSHLLEIYPIDGKRACHIHGLWVDSIYRGKGIASLILTELESWSKELSFNKCILETLKEKYYAISFYKKNGYKEVPNFGDYMNAENSICFSKQIK